MAQENADIVLAGERKLGGSMRSISDWLDQRLRNYGPGMPGAASNARVRSIIM